MLSSLNCNLCVYLDLTSGANEINMSGCETHERSGRVVILTVFIISSRNVPWNPNKKSDARQQFFPLSPEKLRQEVLAWTLCFQRGSKVPDGATAGTSVVIDQMANKCF